MPFDARQNIGIGFTTRKELKVKAEKDKGT
jgi:hypothetical protein